MVSILHIRIFLIIWGLTLHSLSVLSQNLVKLNGKVSDTETLSPLSFAYVYVSSERFATITNLLGEFELKIDSAALNDTLLISFLGYIPFATPVYNVINDTVRVRLKSDLYYIREITITPDYATQVLNEVIDKIPQNILTESYKQRAFYREIIEENHSQVQYAEAVFDVHRILQKNKHKDRIELIKGRITLNKKSGGIWSYIDFVDGPFEMVKSDVNFYSNKFVTVPQNPINFLNPKHFKFYQYTLLQNSTNEWIIEFIPKKKYRKAAYSGRIYIDPQSYAIKTIFYEIYDERINQVSLIPYNTERYLQDFGIENHSLNYYCIIQFKTLSCKQILKSVRMEYQMVFNSRHEDIFSYISNLSEFVITNTEIGNVKKVKYKNALQLRQSLVNQIHENDSTFWDEHNIIKVENRESFYKKEK